MSEDKNCDLLFEYLRSILYDSQIQTLDVAKLEEETARAMYQAVAVLQRAEADATDLLGRAGLSNPLRWQALSSQWPTAFSTLPVEVSVTITVTERQ